MNHLSLSYGWGFLIFEPVAAEVKAERRRQQEKFGEQNPPDALDGNATGIVTGDEAKLLTEAHFAEGRGTWLDILVEEVAEAADEAYAGDLEALRTELVQVAAVTVAWIEAIDRRTRR